MFAAGPATNIFAAFILIVLLGQVAGQFSAADPGVHSAKSSLILEPMKPVWKPGTLSSQSTILKFLLPTILLN